MNKGHTARQSILLQAPAVRVWEALTRPELVKQYLFGTEMSADWRVGGAVTYRGQWQGRSYQDKGEVRVFDPPRRLATTYWSSLSGLQDEPENYSLVTYELAGEGGATRLTVTQDNNPSSESARHSEANWAAVLEGIRRLVESGPPAPAEAKK